MFALQIGNPFAIFENMHGSEQMTKYRLWMTNDISETASDFFRQLSQKGKNKVQLTLHEKNLNKYQIASYDVVFRQKKSITSKRFLNNQSHVKKLVLLSGFGDRYKY